MRILLVSTYELGHQPIHLGTAQAALQKDGHRTRCLDLAVDPWDDEAVAWADAVAFSVPMHTAMRLAEQAARRIRGARTDLPMAYYGLYAGVGTMDDEPVTRIAGEYETGLRAWAVAIESGTPPDGLTVATAGGPPSLPIRDGLPVLDRYAHLQVDDQLRRVGYVEASHGCRHRCRHCPLPTVYDGRIRIVDQDVVLADIDRLVDQGAQHITFGDPDFFNGVHHARRVVAGMHERHPHLTFDATVKVEHILRDADVWPEMAAAGCLFVVSAFEVMNDEILRRLDKRHTAVDAARAVHLLRDLGIEIRPSWLPFTPWTTLEDVTDIFEFIDQHDLVENTDPVQLSIRLLIPEGSLLLELPELQQLLGPYDRTGLSYRWHATDPSVDGLQQTLAEIAQRSVGDPIAPTFDRMWAAAADATGSIFERSAIPSGATTGRPRLMESWFC